jgi:predicted TIM-barrel fold metal-dependent hydrolase
MSDLEKIAIRDEVKPGIFKDNAAKLLGLTG